MNSRRLDIRPLDRRPSAPAPRRAPRFAAGMRLALLAAACAGLFAGVPATAQVQNRILPADSVRGTMSPVSGFDVLLDGSRVTLGAGVVIRNAGNLVIVPSAIPPSADVRYHRDQAGFIDRVWILNAGEKGAPSSYPYLGVR